MLKFWNRLMSMANSRLAKRVLLWCYDNPENNWCAEIKHISVLMDMQNVYNTKGIFNNIIVELKVKELMFNEWQEDVHNKPKLRTYCIFKDLFVTEPYVLYCVPKYLRSIFAQIRLGILPLHVETGRFTNVFNQETGLFRKKTLEERTCNICNSGQVEDEKHFLFYCEGYQYERESFLAICTDKIENFGAMETNEKLKYLMFNEWKLFAKYIFDIWSKRKSLEYT